MLLYTYVQLGYKLVTKKLQNNTTFELDFLFVLFSSKTSKLDFIHTKKWESILSFEDLNRKTLIAYTNTGQSRNMDQE